jgi:hypothetical protein
MKKDDIVVCIDPGMLNLTKGKKYEVLNAFGGFVSVKDDLKKRVDVQMTRFELDEVEIVKKLLKNYNLSKRRNVR